MIEDPLNTYPLETRCQITGTAYQRAMKMAKWRASLPWWRRIIEAVKDREPAIMLLIQFGSAAAIILALILYGLDKSPVPANGADPARSASPGR